MNKEGAWQEVQQPGWPEGTTEFLRLVSLMEQRW